MQDGFKRAAAVCGEEVTKASIAVVTRPTRKPQSSARNRARDYAVSRRSKDNAQKARVVHMTTNWFGPQLNARCHHRLRQQEWHIGFIMAMAISIQNV